MSHNEGNLTQQVNCLNEELLACRSELDELRLLKDKTVASENMINDFKTQLKRKDETIFRLQHDKSQIKQEVNEQIQKVEYLSTVA